MRPNRSPTILRGLGNHSWVFFDADAMVDVFIRSLYFPRSWTHHARQQPAVITTDRVHVDDFADYREWSNDIGQWASVRWPSDGPRTRRCPFRSSRAPLVEDRRCRPLARCHHPGRLHRVLSQGHPLLPCTGLLYPDEPCAVVLRGVPPTQVTTTGSESLQVLVFLSLGRRTARRGVISPRLARLQWLFHPSASFSPRPAMTGV